MRIDHGDEQIVVTLRLRTHAEALAIVPYLHSLMTSIRENWLALQQVRARIRRIDRRPGRPDRAMLIEREESGREARQAEDQFSESLNELMSIDIYCVDPVGGVAQIPFRASDELGWFVFDLFSPTPLDAWRLHADPIGTRRPLIDRSAQHRSLHRL